jgi:hypothetical protein
MIRRLSELLKFRTFEERYQYLKLDGIVAYETFGYDRYLNQMLYKSKRWRKLRDDIIIRDDGCDLGIEDREIYDKIIIHHMNPITIDDIVMEKSVVFNPEFLICVSDNTHRAIHFGNESMLVRMPIERKPNDTCPWKEDYNER